MVTLDYRRTASKDIVESASRNADSRSLEHDFHLRCAGANAGRVYLNSTGTPDIVENTQSPQAFDSAGRKESPTYLVTRKPVSLECNRINTQPREFAYARSACKATADYDNIPLNHLSATRTRR
jgi:hypothetical protein